MHVVIHKPLYTYEEAQFILLRFMQVYHGTWSQFKNPEDITIAVVSEI